MAGIFYYITKSNYKSYPTIVNLYKCRYEQMAEPVTKKHLINYTKSINDSIEGLGYMELLMWEHRHLKYPSTEGEENWWSLKVYTEGRPEEPIKILSSSFLILDSDGYLKVLGRCGEFALLYTGLCLANNIEVRLIIDCSSKTDSRSAGDHVWNQIYTDGEWITIDPTENKINEPYLYRDKWNKNINLVYAITTSEIIDITETYN